LESYLKTESLRLGDRLQYEINVADDLDAFDTNIPSILLQPYVENAIWHGISPKKEGGNLSISFEKTNNKALLITIKDDGVGRIKARENKAQQTGVHQSKGLKITEERLALFDRKHGTQSSIETVDLVDNEGVACGTEVRILIN
jgi:sensor histidine kinase YesM